MRACMHVGVCSMYVLRALYVCVSVRVRACECLCVCDSVCVHACIHVGVYMCACK